MCWWPATEPEQVQGSCGGTFFVPPFFIRADNVT